MRKRLSVFLLAAALTLGFTYGGIAMAQPPQGGEHFPGNHLPKPDMKGPDGGNFKELDGNHPGKEMRDNLRHEKKDFQDRVDHGKKDFKEKGKDFKEKRKGFKDRMKHDKKFDKRGDGNDFRPGEHRERPDFGKPDHNGRPGGRDIPDFGQHRK